MADDSQAQPQPTVTRGGGVDLNSPFFRQLEDDRGLPAGVLSGMAEKESGGNTLKRASDPNSSASGLFQITNATGRDWGLSAADRLDPVKSATAVADVLARRANQYGIERAVGMHYGGVGTPWDQTVGSSGLSPAGYSADVFRRAQQYTAAPPQTVGFPSPAFDAESPPQAQPQGQEQNFYRQYLQSTAPDGSTTIREIVSPNLLDHDAAVAAEQRAGYTFQNFVDPARMSGVQTTAVPPAQAQPETPLLPSAVVPTSGTVPASYTPPPAPASPGSSPWLNLIPPALATAGPLALSIAQPEIGVPLWALSGGVAALGGGGGEAIREKLAGEPISPSNIAEQGAVSGVTDVAMGPVEKYVLSPIARFATGKLGRVLTAAEDLGPTLTSEGTTVAAPAASLPPPPLRVTGVHAIDLAAQGPEELRTGIQALAKQATEEERPALAAAWVNTMRQRAANAGDPVTYMRAAYEGLGEEAQANLFGAGKGAYERMLSTAWGGTPGELTNLIGEATAGGGITTGAHYGSRYLGIPGLGLPTTISGVRTAADLTAPFFARGMLVSPGAAQFGARLSRFGGVAGPAAADFAAQSVAERARQLGVPTF